MCHIFTILSRIDRHPSPRLIPHALKQPAHPCLQRLLLIALRTVAASGRRLLWREIEEEREIRGGQGDVGRATPREREALGGGEDHAGERVPIAEHRRARRQLRLERARGFPPVRGEEQVDRAVV